MTVTAAEVRREWSTVGRQLKTAATWTFYGAGFGFAKLLRWLMWLFVAVFYAAGWVGAQVAWPALCWAGKAARLGWDDARAGKARPA